MHCLVVEDERILLDLLGSVVESFSEISTVFKAQTIAAAEMISHGHGLDLALLDLQLPDGQGGDLARHLVERHTGIQLIVLSGAAEQFACPAELEPAVKAVINKASAFASLRQSLNAILQPAEQQLTQRQQEIYTLIGAGRSTKEIARQLGCSVATVETHRKAIARTLGLSGAELVKAAALATQRQAIQ
ncbi:MULTISPECIES: response regulator [unclassified Synechococcus]|uniref:response regulator n=1 Tax=unclassified Synechococcus TaxID=2626047 RepID=UPI000068FC36|nr:MULTISPECIES: response regulator [unclassified Synechococcus]EAQ68191.1 Two-component response regulator, CheY-like receiver and wHTH DNA-binding domains [Synechococcus sp. RS9917]